MGPSIFSPLVSITTTPTSPADAVQVGDDVDVAALQLPNVALPASTLQSGERVTGLLLRAQQVTPTDVAGFLTGYRFAGPGTQGIRNLPSIAYNAPKTSITKVTRNGMVVADQNPNVAPVTPSSSAWNTAYEALGVAGVAIGAYHGYKRNESVGWAIAWAVLGALAPIVVIPVAVAQGIGKRA